MNVHKCLRWPDMSKSLHSFNMLQQIPKGGMWILLNQLKIIVSYVITNVWHLYCSFHSEKFSNIHRSREKSTVNPFVGTTSLKQLPARSHLVSSGRVLQTPPAQPPLIPDYFKVLPDIILSQSHKLQSL